MNKHFFLVIGAAALITPLHAQPRSATMRGGGNGRDGKCTIEVVVDGTAEVEIRGASAQMRTLAGQNASWRRFECNGVLPPRPANFRFQGIDGRGRQTLVHDPRDGGPVVVRIEDPQGGSEGYTFDIMWGGGGFQTHNVPPPPPPPPAGGDRDGDRWHDQRRDFGRDDWRGHIFERVRDDLEHVQSETFPRGGDQYRLGQARRELDDLQAKLAGGRYDQREVDDVISAIRNVVRDNRMAPRDRDLLTNDLNQLSDFRQRHDAWGAR